MTTNNPFLQHALHYASLGWYVFPVNPGQKTPRTANGFKAATLDREQIIRWWTDWPDCNVGIAMAESGLIVYDVDIKGDKGEKLGARSHAEIAHHLTPTLKAKTRSGGTHLYYRAPVGAPIQVQGLTAAEITAPPGKSGLDLIGAGYVLAAPSIVEGGSYEWETTGEQIIAPLPEFIHTNALHKTRRENPEPAHDDEVIGEGTRNATMFRKACQLRNAGMTELETLVALQIINEKKVKPPLPLSELKTIAWSAARTAEFDVEGGSEALVRQVLAQATAPQIVAGEVPPEAPDQNALSVDDLLDKMLLGIGSKEPQPPVKVFPTGFSELDRLLGGGFSTRQLCVILGGPGAGKSALAVSFSRKLTEPREGYEPPPILIVSTELEFFEIAARFAAPSMGVPWRDILKMDGANIPVSQATKDYPVYCLDTTRVKIQFTEGLKQITDIIGHIAKRHGQPPVLIVDYLQQLGSKVEKTEVRQRVSDVAETLRIISQQHSCAVIALCTVSREGYGSKLALIREANDPEGYIGLGKESGQIEYEAATVIFVDVEQEESSLFRVGRFVLAKVRHGTRGFVGAKFDPALGIYTEEAGAGQTMARKNRAEENAEQRVLEKIMIRPGEYSQSEIAKEMQVSPAIVGSLLAKGKIQKRQNKLYLVQTPIQNN